MFLASVINAKVHLISGLIIGGLFVAASVQMKRNGSALLISARLCSQFVTDIENPIT